MNKERKSSERIFSELYDEYYRRVNSYFSKCFDGYLSEDLTQQVFLKLWIYILSKPDREVEKPKSFIFSIAANVKNDYYRIVCAKPTAPLEDITEAAAPGNVEESVEIMLAFNSLPQDDQTVLNMKQAGMSSKEIGDYLGISSSGARSRVQYAAQKLKNKLK